MRAARTTVLPGWLCPPLPDESAIRSRLRRRRVEREFSARLVRSSPRSGRSGTLARASAAVQEMADAVAECFALAIGVVCTESLGLVA